MPTNGPHKTTSVNNELLDEVRQLATAVSLLHAVFVRRKVLYLVLGIESAIVAIALGVAGFFIGLEHAHTNKIIGQLVDTCQVRNDQIDATKTYLKHSQELNARGQAINAKLIGRLNLHLTAADVKELAALNKEYTQVLHDYFVAQPADIICKAYKTGG